MKGRITLVGDAAGYVTKCSGEGIYFAAKWVAPRGLQSGACRTRFRLLQSGPAHRGDACGCARQAADRGCTPARRAPPCRSGRMAGEAIVKASEGGKKMAGERALRNYLDEFDRKYWVSGGPVL